VRKPPNSYGLYGFRLSSCLELPCGRAPGEGPPDVEIFSAPERFFRKAAASERYGSASWYHHAPLADGSVYLRWGRLFEFLVSADGRRIACHPLADGSAEAFHTYLSSQVLSFALVKQGIEPLHATTLVADGAAFGLLGSSGHGKSTLAAAFLTRGCRLLTDDLLVVRPDGAGYRAFPGPARIKLFPEIARAVLGETAAGVPMNNLTPKMILPLGRRRYCSTPVPLRALYLLSYPGPRAGAGLITLRGLSERRAYLALLRHCFNTKVRDRERLKRQFLAATELAARLPLKLLSYPRDLTRLGNVCAAVLADLEK